VGPRSDLLFSVVVEKAKRQSTGSVSNDVGS
jgi:hypothetical protein